MSARDDDHGLDLERLLDAAVAAAEAGSAIVRGAFRTGLAVHSKAHNDWVTDADRTSEGAIRAVLADADPTLAFLGEETGGERAEVGWFVDPLDGTSNFVHGFPVVGVSIGLVAHGEPVVGVVQLPLLGEVYAARRGGGATCNGVPVQVSRRPFSAAILATGFPFRRKEGRLGPYLAAMERVLWECEDLRRAGAAALDLAWTGCGSFEGYFELGLGPWDVAAGAAIVREAGGVVTDWSGDPDAWLRTGDVVAATPQVHERLLELLAPG